MKMLQATSFSDELDQNCTDCHRIELRIIKYKGFKANGSQL